MRKTLITAVLLLSGSAAEAQNALSKQLLSMSVPQRNAAFTGQLKSLNEKCDEVVKTQFNGSAGSVDDWEAKCRDGSMYSMSVPASVNGRIVVMTCRELRAANIAMGGKKEPLGCQMK